VQKLFETLAPRFAGRPGGYTRLLRIGFRRGDAAEVAQVELVGSEFNPRAAAESEAKKAPGEPAAKGVGGRLRAAANRLRGKKGQTPTEGTTGERPAGKGKKSAGSKAKKKKEDAD
jgi:large subunit ribosomal protein L17